MLTNRQALLFAGTAGLAVADMYFAQPLLVTLAHDFGLTPATTGLVVTLTQVGCALGLLLVVPLGDLLNRRRLVLAQTLLMALALVVVGTAHHPAVLLTGLAAVGTLSVVAQVLVAFAATLAGPGRRGRVVGLVTSGGVVGILLARTVSGALADLAGWRAVYLCSAAATVLLALALRRVLPAEPVRTGRRYLELLRNTGALFVREPVFRTRALLTMLLFASFSILWSGVALPLSAPPWSLSHTAIGAFGLVAAAGALAASGAGRLADRGLGQRVTGIALVLLTVSWLPLAFTRESLWALALGALLLDLAVQAVHVTSQSMVYAVRPDAGSSLIGAYMVCYSIGSGLGALATTAVHEAAGWIGVSVLGVVVSAAALVFWVTMGRPENSLAFTGPRE